MSVQVIDKTAYEVREYRDGLGEPKALLKPEHAQSAIDHLKYQGFVEPEVLLVQNVYKFFGLEKGNKIYIFAHNASIEHMHRILFHEYGHSVHKRSFRGDLLDIYFAIRGKPQNLVKAPYFEVFAEDFRFLFGTPEAKKERHTRWQGAVDPWSMSSFERQTGGWDLKIEDMRNCIVAHCRKAGMMLPKFKDVPFDRWSSQAVENQSRKGRFEGYPDGTFRPEEPVTREQLAVVLERMDRELASKP